MTKFNSKLAIFHSRQPLPPLHWGPPELLADAPQLVAEIPEVCAGPPKLFPVTDCDDNDDAEDSITDNERMEIR